MCQVMGICYQLLTKGSVHWQALPCVVWAIVSTVQLHGHQQDVGRTIAQLIPVPLIFASWLGNMGDNNWTVRLIGLAEGSMILEGYLYTISTRADAHLHLTKSTIQGSTLLLYMKAASLWLHSKLGVDIPIICPHSQKIVQPFCDTIAQALKWGMPQPKHEPTHIR